MELIGSIANNLTSAVQSAPRLRGQAVHADTLAHGRSSPPCPPSAGRGLKRTYLTSHSGTRARAGRSYPLMAAFDPFLPLTVSVPFGAPVHQDDQTSITSCRSVQAKPQRGGAISRSARPCGGARMRGHLWRTDGPRWRRPLCPGAILPIAVLLLPVVLVESAALPTAVLLLAVLLKSASTPRAVLSMPVML